MFQAQGAAYAKSPGQKDLGLRLRKASAAGVRGTGGLIRSNMWPRKQVGPYHASSCKPR